ncbi:MAG TPA: class I SAM-dependent methyltransferase [Bryobacteraceae bacterium]|jgi:ubiquinone/menaquinone biosynthesis C-methylase UbiE|nr:class I SAM-dependent methyltransferase [Bryobacteraceae bacterium]
MAPALPKPHKDRGMEGMVAKWYTTNTGKTLDEFAKLARRIADQLPRGSNVLEVAPGPGFFCIELAKLGTYSITGLDISHTFVEIASKKADEAGVRVDFRQGNASSMPFVDNSFDFLLCRAAFKNFAQPVRALQEMCRVLKPGGRALIIDLRKDASMEDINHHVEGMGLGAVNKVLTKLAFRTMLLKSAYTRQQFQHMLAQANFRSVDIQEADIGFEISMAK